MGVKKSKKGFLKNLWGLVKGGENDVEEKSEADIDFSATEDQPVDLNFVQLFSACGGKFLYCEEEGEAYSYLKQIAEESQIELVYCLNDNLSSILQKAGINVTQSIGNAEAFCSGCEFLISFNGGVMFSDKQARGIKYSDLPEIFITIARTSQITKNLSTALSGIRKKYPGSIPANITTVRGRQEHKISTGIEEGSFVKKDIYLLLVEDQL